jgi:hypothetical protein
MRTNESIVPADNREAAQQIPDDIERAYRAYGQNLNALLPTLPTDLIVLRANDQYYMPATDSNEDMVAAAENLEKTWGGDAENRIPGPVDIYVLAMLHMNNPTQVRASRNFARTA